MKKASLASSENAIHEELSSGRLSSTPAGYVTASMAMQRLGVAPRQWRRFVSLGQIKACTRNNQGWSLYREEDVIELGKLYVHEETKHKGPRMLSAAVHTAMAFTAQEQAQVFTLLKQNMPLVDIALHTGLHTSVVQAIVRDYDNFAGRIVLTREQLDIISRLPLEVVLPIENGEQLVDALRWAARSHSCERCRTRKCSRFCVACTKSALLAAEGGDKKKNASAHAGKKPAANDVSDPGEEGADESVPESATSDENESELERCRTREGRP